MESPGIVEFLSHSEPLSFDSDFGLEEMKIVRKSNWDHDDYRGNQWFVAENIKDAHLGQIMVEALNEAGGDEDDDFYQIVEDDFKLRPDWQP